MLRTAQQQTCDRVCTYGPPLAQKPVRPTADSELSLPSAKTQAVSDRSGSSSWNNKQDSFEQHMDATATKWIQKWSASTPTQPRQLKAPSADGTDAVAKAPEPENAASQASGTAASTHKPSADEQRNEKSISDDASEGDGGQLADAARPAKYVVRPLSATPAYREANRPEPTQRPLSASGQPRLHGGVQHAEFLQRPQSGRPSEAQQGGSSGESCSLEQREFLQRQLAASASHRRGLPDMYSFGRVIGVGSFGTVRLAYHKLSGQKVAIKTYERAKMKDQQQWKRVQQEARVMEKLSDCPLVCRFLEAFETAAPRRAHLIMEHLTGGSLCSYVKAKRKLPEGEVRPLMLQLAMAIEHMHSLDVVHRDIKLENILFLDDTHKVVRVIDFGFSTRCAADRRLRLFCGTPSYMAPEIVRRTEYRGKPIDLWSFGVVTYACLGGYFPFAARSQPELYRKILRGTFRLPDGLSGGAAALLQAAILVDVQRRISAPEARRHHWLMAGLSSRDLKLGTELGPYTRSKNPQDDMHRESLSRVTDGLGVPRDVLVRGIVQGEHTPITACYYLLMGTLRKQQSTYFQHSEYSDAETVVAKSTVAA